jgi:hypothetical protein
MSMTYEDIGQIETESGTVAEEVEFRLKLAAQDIERNPSDKARKVNITIAIKPVRDGFNKIKGADISAAVDMAVPKPADASKGEPTTFMLSEGQFIKVADQGDMLNGD